MILGCDRHNLRMARAVWSGTISFGLVSVPVRLYPATRRKDVRFHEIDRLSGQRIRHQKVVEATPSLPSPRGGGDYRTASLAERGRENLAAREIFARGDRDARPQPDLSQMGTESIPPIPQRVAPHDVVKGFEVAKDRYVTVDREELEELAPERTRTIDVEQFVDASAVDPIYFDISYYAVPDRGYERAYGLLVDVMRETKKIAISWFVLRRKRYLAALRPQGRLMVLTTMFHADEILPTAELEPGKPTDLRKNEREMATLLINTLSGPFEPERYPDEYRQRLNALIEGRAASARPAGIAGPTGTGVQDLMAALRASVEQARLASKNRTKPAARRKRKSA
jgi:DNA end-binding protein Ku